MTRKDGTPVNAVFGFTNMLARLLQNHEGTHIAVIFDAGRVTFRNALYADYKAHRPEPPSELIPQFALVREATAAFGVPAIELNDYEADDLIASYAVAATTAGMRVTIVSSDKDLMQLVTDRVTMQDPIKNKPIGPAEVQEKFGVEPARVIDVQALMGDSVDNVPGVPGIGPKNAAQLIQEFGNLEGVLTAAPTMKPSKRRDMLIQHAEAARISRKLVELCCTIDLPLPLDALIARDAIRPELVDWLLQQGFRSTVNRLGLDGPAPVTQQPPPAVGTETFGAYDCITTLDALLPWIAGALATGTLGLHVQGDRIDARRAELLGIGLCIAPGRACYIPLAHTSPELLGDPTTYAQIPRAEALAALAPLFTHSAVQKSTHDAKAAMLTLDRAGLALTPVDDVMMMSYAQEAGAHGHTLADLATLHFAHAMTSLDQVTGTGRGRLTMAQVPPARATTHAAEAADLALRLATLLRPRLRTARSLAAYHQVDQRLVPVLMRMEQAGVKVDEAELRRMSADFAARMEVMEAEIFIMAGRSFNLGSAKQLGEILFDEQKLPGAKRLPSGTWSTDASVLQDLAEQGHRLPERALEYRQIAKLRSTYTEALVDEIDRTTGRVHTRFAQAIASTGRLSSTEPNLQNIPIRTEEGARIRKAFVAEPGHVLVSCDYSQIELRLMAHVADIPALKEAFATGQDIHARTASEVFGVPIEGMDRTTRNRAKAINFGIIYGISAFGLARQLSIEPGEAKTFIDAYFDRYPGIRAYMERTKEEARINGYVLTPFGRRCWVPGIADRIPQKRAYAERQAINAPLQGGAADVIKAAMVRLPRALADAGLKARLLLQVHDELLFEAADDEADATAAIAKRIMEGAASLSVPLVVETGHGRNWSEAH